MQVLIMYQLGNIYTCIAVILFNVHFQTVVFYWLGGTRLERRGVMWRLELSPLSSDSALMLCKLVSPTPRLYYIDVAHVYIQMEIQDGELNSI